jgi:hypothetical protein
MSAFPVNVVEFTRALEGWMGRASVLAIAQEKKKKKKKKKRKMYESLGLIRYLYSARPGCRFAVFLAPACLAPSRFRLPVFCADKR